MEKVLVLNADYTPLNVTTVFKGFNLVTRGKAEVLKSSDNPLSAGPKTFKKNKIRVNRMLKPTIGGYIRTQFKLFSEDYRVTVLSVKWK